MRKVFLMPGKMWVSFMYIKAFIPTKTRKQYVWMDGQMDGWMDG